tara:strand:- start:392 stop:577 length:186 start_codon:yes stop_codon:yes gene_type:complete
MEKFKGGLQKGMEEAGTIDYIFGVLGFISILPVLAAYIILIKLIWQPLTYLKDYLKAKIWK